LGDFATTGLLGFLREGTPVPEYDAFISYTGTDRAWADKLRTGLEQRGRSLFFDRTRLQAGDEWDEQLLADLERSRHLIVLWSDSARGSDWVNQEIAYFRSTLRRSSLSDPEMKRRIVQLRLEGMNTALSKYQTVTALVDRGAYSAGADAVEADLWRGVLDTVEQSISPGDISVPVRIVVLALTKDRLQRIDMNRKPAFAVTFGEFLGKLGIDKLTLARQYGDDPLDWKPFGKDLSMGAIMESVRERIIAIAPLHPLRWTPVDDEFWSEDPDALDRQVRLLASELSVIVVDPIALYDEELESRFQRMHTLLPNDGAAIVVLDPFPVPSASLSIRELLKQVSIDLFRHVYQREVPTPYVGAVCGVNVRDPDELGRLVQFTFGRSLYITQRPAIPDVMKVGQ
jgi:hypothetical protein